MGDSQLITVDRIQDLVKEKIRKTKEEEWEYKQHLKEISERINSRELLFANYDEKNHKRQTRAKLLLQQ